MQLLLSHFPVDWNLKHEPRGYLKVEASKRVFELRDDRREVNLREGGSVRPDLNSRSREDAR